MKAYVGAGNIELGRGKRSGAEKYAQMALKVDPGSDQAIGLLNSVRTAIQQEEDIDDVRARRGLRRGGRR